MTPLRTQTLVGCYALVLWLGSPVAPLTNLHLTWGLAHCGAELSQIQPARANCPDQVRAVGQPVGQVPSVLGRRRTASSRLLLPPPALPMGLASTWPGAHNMDGISGLGMRLRRWRGPGVRGTDGHCPAWCPGQEAAASILQLSGHCGGSMTPWGRSSPTPPLCPLPLGVEARRMPRAGSCLGWSWGHLRAVGLGAGWELCEPHLRPCGFFLAITESVSTSPAGSRKPRMRPGEQRDSWASQGLTDKHGSKSLWPGRGCLPPLCPLEGWLGTPTICVPWNP